MEEYDNLIKKIRRYKPILKIIIPDYKRIEKLNKTDQEKYQLLIKLIREFIAGSLCKFHELYKLHNPQAWVMKSMNNPELPEYKLYKKYRKQCKEDWNNIRRQIFGGLTNDHKRQLGK